MSGGSMGSMDRTTVVIPTYERAAYLRAAIDSVLAQTRPVDEILVVDDASTDGTDAVVATYGDRVTYLRKDANTGKSASLNLAIARAAHPLIWIVDDDDLARPDAHERLAGLLAADPDAGFAYGRHERFVEEPGTGARRMLGTGYWRAAAPDDFLVATLEDFFAHQPGMLVRKSLYETVGPFDTRLTRSQDYEMAIRLARAARPAVTEAVVFDQRVHDGARGSQTDRFEAGSAQRRWLEADQRIFREVYRSFPLSAYLPGAPADLDAAQTRRALIQRGVIMARKRLWREATRDFRAALRLGRSPLSSEERAILARAFGSKYGVADVLEDAGARRSLAALARSRGGAGLGAGLARGLRWRVREAATGGRLGCALYPNLGSNPTHRARLEDEGCS